MGRGDNRKSRKALQRKAQRRKKLRLRNKIEQSASAAGEANTKPRASATNAAKAAKPKVTTRRTRDRSETTSL